ncbi:MAG: polysaccharide biosynthesis/export family protein [Beijerinckiaceae bacterium]|nr:polysaccharide biosynthesis/export family protein [Beijerinckiaceae bacterium]
MILPLAACESPVALTNVDVSSIENRPVRIQVGEKVRVSVFGEPTVSGDYDVDPGGYITVPLAGPVKAEGLTRQGLEAAITARLRGEFIRDPKVTTDIVLYRPLYVIGEVERPGEVPYRGGANALTVLALAGGPTYRASKQKLMIKRVEDVDFKEYPISPLVPVYPGDVIRVPERFF